jgi:hypothetical protein
MHYPRPELDRFATAVGVRVTAPLPEDGMDDEDIARLYLWALGSCFRCARSGVDTTSLDRIDTPAGVCYDVRACRACVIDLEHERMRRARRVGSRYVPGMLGH